MKYLFVLHSFNVNGVLKQNLNTISMLRGIDDEFECMIFAPDDGSGQSLYESVDIRPHIFTTAENIKAVCEEHAYEPDVIFFESLFSVNESVSKLFPGKRKIIRVHEKLPFKSNTRLWAKESRCPTYYFSYFASAYFIFVCEGLREYYSELMYLNGVRGCVINGVVNESEIDEKVNHLVPGGDKFTILQLGTIYQRKGVLETLEAFNSFHDMIGGADDVRLILCGARRASQAEIKYENELRSLIDSYGLIDKVIIHETTDNPYPYLSESNLLTMHSFSEAYPTVILEAMYMGKPVVSSDVGCISEMIMPGVNGVLFEVGDVLMQAEYFRQIYKGEAGMAGVESIRDLYHSDFSVSQVKQMLQQNLYDLR